MTYKLEITASSADELGQKVSDLYAIYGVQHTASATVAVVEPLPVAAPEVKAAPKAAKKAVKPAPVVEAPKVVEPEEEELEDGIEDMDDLSEEEDAEDDIEDVEEEALTIDDLRSRMQKYIDMHGLDQARQDGLKILSDSLGKPPAGREFWSVSLINELDDNEIITKAVIAWDDAVKAGKRYGA